VGRGRGREGQGMKKETSDLPVQRKSSQPSRQKGADLMQPITTRGGKVPQMDRPTERSGGCPWDEQSQRAYIVVGRLGKRIKVLSCVKA